MKKKTAVGIIIGTLLLLSLGLLFKPKVETEELLIGKENSDLIKIKLTGAVLFPGEYEGEVGMPLASLIQLAGGFLENADYDNLNLAEKITDSINLNIEARADKKSTVVFPKFYENGEYAFIYGAVKCPGVYPISGLMTVYDLIQLAGGLSADASLNKVALYDQVTDQMKIKIPKSLAKENASPLVNLNTAGFSELITLNGVGKAKAEAIINYRIQNGNFKSINELLNISGIGEGIFNQIKDFITV